MTTTREQDVKIDSLCLEHGEVKVEGGYEDGAVKVTLPDRRGEMVLDRWGHPQPVVNVNINKIW